MVLIFRGCGNGRLFDSEMLHGENVTELCTVEKWVVLILCAIVQKRKSYASYKILD